MRKIVDEFRGYKSGDEIYVPTSLYLSHGVDDFIGGRATIENIYEDDRVSRDSYNRWGISIKERPGHWYNLSYLIDEQEELKKKFGDSWCYEDPDYSPSANQWD